MKKTYIGAFLILIALLVVLNVTNVFSLKTLFSTKDKLTASSLDVSQSFSDNDLYQCGDTVDNDKDGLIDYPSDPGCTSVTDNDELNKPITVKDEVMFLGGTTDGITSPNDVYTTSDMETWKLVSANNPSSPFSPSYGPQTIYFNNKYWIIGTCCNQGIDNVWNSSDGTNWTLVNSNPPFKNYYETKNGYVRYGYRPTVLGNKIYVVGGTPEATTAVMWSSTDGVSWTASNTPFTPRRNATVTTNNGKIYFMGGLNIPFGGSTSSVWASDGIRWKEITTSAPWGNNRLDPKAISFNGKIYLFGGQSYSGNGSASIWSSAEGTTWDLVSNTFPEPTQYFFINRGLTVLNGKIWISSSTNTSKNPNKLWSSPDGVTWTQSTSTPPWSPRSGFSFVPNK